MYLNFYLRRFFQLPGYCYRNWSANNSNLQISLDLELDILLLDVSVLEANFTYTYQTWYLLYN